MTFSSLGLSAELLRALTEKGYTAPTPIQTQAIPAILAHHDLMASAQTGTGKTAAFALPMLQCLSEAKNTPKGRVRALVLTPTRELAAQVSEAVRTYGRHMRLRSTEVYGGVNINPQIKQLRQGVDILIATPGRLLDHLQRRTTDLSSVEMLVLDEADRMLDMGFLPAIERIVKQLPRERQTLLFSATFSTPIRKLAGRFLVNPKSIEVARRNAVAEAVVHSAYRIDTARKRELLAHLIEQQNWQQVLVFTRTKHGADRLAKQLDRQGIESTAIHGGKSQGQRTRALKQFKHSRVRALVATDVAARGLDIRELPHVVNFDLPENPEDYVHRIGRTGRAGNSGNAVSLVSSDQRGGFSAIKKLIKIDIPLHTVDGFAPTQAGPAANSPASNRRQAAQRRPRRDHGVQNNDNHSGKQRRSFNQARSEADGNRKPRGQRAESSEQVGRRERTRQNAGSRPQHTTSKRTTQRHKSKPRRGQREQAFIG